MLSFSSHSTRKGGRINFKAGDIDHIVPLADGGTNDIDNLQFISTEEHCKKTEQGNRKR